MHPHSEIILKKMVDHFGRWEEPVLKKSRIEKKKEIRIPKQNKRKDIQRTECEFTNRRREEILFSIEELKILKQAETLEMRISNDTYTKNRQKELLRAKEILQAEIGRNPFSLAS